jgi:elongation factor Ts
MPEITAAAVKALREKTNLPMMDCKKALEQAGGDAEKAVQLLREAGKKISEKRAGKETTSGRIAVVSRLENGVGAMVEFLCESAPVANSEGFTRLTNDLVEQLANGPGAKTADELLDQPSPSGAAKTLREQLDVLTNQIRELFKVGRLVRIDGPCGGYAHHNASAGVLLEIEGKLDATVAKDICMHIVAMRPAVVSPADLDPAAVEQEREVLRAAARQEGKPEKIIEKMVEGRLKDFYAERCLTEQPFVKDSAKTVGQVAKEAGFKPLRFVHWELGKG